MFEVGLFEGAVVFVAYFVYVNRKAAAPAQAVLRMATGPQHTGGGKRQQRIEPLGGGRGEKGGGEVGAGERLTGSYRRNPGNETP